MTTLPNPETDPEACDDCGEWVIEGPLCLACMDDRLALERERDGR